ncbi:MAG TPA: hypothetical protein VMS94_04120 [Acidobacteriota bacterium]|jgi:hypothetical protein|nr:hypothetical protein [Acidobacteriota bacterium]
MLNQVKNVLNRKQKASLFGIITRSIYAEKDLGSVTKFSNDMSIEMVKDYQIRAEQERARAMGLLLRRASV